MTMSEMTSTLRRARVLVEAPPYPWHALVKEAQGLFECEVRVCGGPLCTDAPCPVVAGEPCPKAAAADVVVAGLGLDTEQGCAVLRGLRATYPHTPIVVPVWRADRTRHADLLAGCRLVPFPWTMDKFRAAVEDALAAKPEAL